MIQIKYLLSCWIFKTQNAKVPKILCHLIFSKY